MTLDQVYDELYGEIDQIKNELKNTLAQIQYASNFTEGVPLGILSVGSESSQVIAPHVALLPGAESGMMILDLPVGTESAMLSVQIQDDPEATELVSDALPTGKTVESYLNSNLGKNVKTKNSSTSAWNGNVLKFTIQQSNAEIFHFVAMANDGTLTEYYLINRTTELIYNKVTGADCTFSYNTTTQELTITLLKSAYWTYSFVNISCGY